MKVDSSNTEGSSPQTSMETSVTKMIVFCKGQDYCVYIRPDGPDNLFFTVHCSQPGWAGIGIGKHMIGAEVDFF
jgi:hypothetical protein